MGNTYPDEREFLATNAGAMLRRLAPQIEERRLYLFACGCCRQVWPLLENPQMRLTVARVEALADDLVTLGEDRASALWPVVSSLATAWAKEATATLKTLGSHLNRQSLVMNVQLVADHAARALRDTVGARDWSAAQKRQSALLFDLLGKRDQPLAIDPRWLRWNDGTLLKMAEAIYREHRFADMPMLGDALEEAGCDSPELLRHCRHHTEHARGCWLLDALRAGK